MNKRLIDSAPASEPKLRKRLFLEPHWLIFLLACAGALRLWHLTWGLPELYEEAIPLRFSMQLWNTHATPIDAAFFVYPALTYYLNFGVQLVHFVIGSLSGAFSSVDAFLNLYQIDPTSFAIQSRLVTVAFDLSTIIVGYQFGIRFADKRVAILAALFLAFNPLHIAQAHLINVDVPLAFLFTLALYFLYRMYVDGSRTSYLFSGLSIGLASATKYNGAILLAPLVIVHLMRSPSPGRALRSLTQRSFLLAITAASVVFAICNPLIFLHSSDFLGKLAQTQGHMESGHRGNDPNSGSIGFCLTESLPANLDEWRYKLEPVRFREMLTFHDTLRTRWKLAYRIESGDRSGESGRAVGLRRRLVQAQEV